MEAANWRCARTSVRRGARKKSGQLIADAKDAIHTSVSADRTGEMRVDGTSEAIVSKHIASYTSRAEVFRGEHTPRRHDAN